MSSSALGRGRIVLNPCKSPQYCISVIVCTRERADMCVYVGRKVSKLLMCVICIGKIWKVGMNMLYIRPPSYTNTSEFNIYVFLFYLVTYLPNNTLHNVYSGNGGLCYMLLFDYLSLAFTW